MPINAYGQTNAFSKAASSQVIRHQNNAPAGEGGVDQKTQEYLAGHGICSGITTTWVIGFVNGRSDSRTPGEFDDYFKNVLRFQGAYLKEIGGRTDSHIDELAQKGLDSELQQVDTVKASTTSGISFPSPTWGAYVAIWGHAIGIGHDGNKWYMMDPNFGLFVYANKSDFMHDFDQIVEARRIRKGKSSGDKITVLVFKKK